MEVKDIKLLIGGSPCTHWSIAQTKNRETEPEGLGWELFKNYLIAKEKFKPDYFLYENNKSMSSAIREQITKELVVEPIMINSALVSAQNRQRLYWTNIPGVEQPEDKGILLRDILENGVCWQEKSYTPKAQYYKNGIANFVTNGGFGATAVAEPLSTTPDGKSFAVTTRECGAIPEDTLKRHRHTMVAEPIRIGTIESDAKNADFDSQQYRVYSPDGKSVTLCGQGGGVGAKTGLYAVPAPIAYEPLDSCDVVVTDNNIRSTYKDGSGTAQGYSVYFEDVKSPSVIAGHAHKMKIIQPATGKEFPVYEVRDGQITIKDKQYPIKLADGYYIIRKLTVTECMRLQTVPEDYIFPVSNSQAYKMLGNGWTVDVIAHILSYAPSIKSEPLEVLSMYDGMSCGRLALNKLGANISRYYATEIDKYAIQTTQHNFPDTIQLGDAFQVREGGWSAPNETIYCVDTSNITQYVATKS